MEYFVLSRLFADLKEINQKLSTNNTVVTNLATDFAKFQADQGKFLSDFSAFEAVVTKFIADATSGANGTQLSPADAATLASIDSALQGLDNGAATADASLSAIQVPTVPVVVPPVTPPTV